MSIITVLDELVLFSEKILTLKEPANREDVKSFERRYNLILPNDYKYLLDKYNGVNLMGTTVYGVGECEQSFSLEKNFLFEHNEVSNPMYDNLIPFSPDGYGNHYCFDINTINRESCFIVFWQHDYNYSIDDLPEVTNASFGEWLKQVVIDWVLEDYNYDGSKK